MDDVRLRPAVAGAAGAGRSQPRPVAGCQCHEQLADASAAGRPRRDEVVGEVAAVAGGLSVVVGSARISAFLDNTIRPIAIVAMAALYIVLWLFLAGGILDRFARDRPTGAHGFFAA